ncbi:hypothetical protein BC829DRAFT_420563 [Chytridium lagenaria]|nr:hypothetical protein BC829DRAFT_420563 [Chytridium lagenaria]
MSLKSFDSSSTTCDINAEILQDSKDPNSPRFTLLQFMIQGGHIRSRPESVNVLLEYESRRRVYSEEVLALVFPTLFLERGTGKPSLSNLRLGANVWNRDTMVGSVDGGRVAIVDALKWNRWLKLVPRVMFVVSVVMGKQLVPLALSCRRELETGYIQFMFERLQIWCWESCLKPTVSLG